MDAPYNRGITSHEEMLRLVTKSSQKNDDNKLSVKFCKPNSQGS